MNAISIWIIRWGTRPHAAAFPFRPAITLLSIFAGAGTVLANIACKILTIIYMALDNLRRRPFLSNKLYAYPLPEGPLADRRAEPSLRGVEKTIHFHPNRPQCGFFTDLQGIMCMLPAVHGAFFPFGGKVYRIAGDLFLVIFSAR
jgi:hypothetical protein